MANLNLQVMQSHTSMQQAPCASLLPLRAGTKSHDPGGVRKLLKTAFRCRSNHRNQRCLEEVTANRSLQLRLPLLSRPSGDMTFDRCARLPSIAAATTQHLAPEMSVSSLDSDDDGEVQLVDDDHPLSAKKR